jgi:hypothetical protein
LASLNYYKVAIRAAREITKFSQVGTREEFLLGNISGRSATESQSSSGDDPNGAIMANILDSGILASEIASTTDGWSSGVDDDGHPQVPHAPFIEGDVIERFAMPIRAIDLTSENLQKLIYGNPLAGAEKGDLDNARSTPRTENTNILLVQVRNKYFSYGAVDENIFDVFFNLIPSMTWSKCTPQMNLSIIIPGKSAYDRNGDDIKINPRISTMRFINGVSTLDVSNRTADFGADFLMLTSNNQTAIEAGEEAERVQDISRQRRGLDPSRITGKVSSAGMDIFTAPQTLLPMWERYSSVDEVANFQDLISPTRSSEQSVSDFSNQFDGAGGPRDAPIIDRTRPFMTLEDVGIEDVPSGHALISDKKLSLKLTLHDRSRLAEIADLIKPSLYAETKISVEWGWNHPIPRNENDDYAKFINALKSEQTFTVTRASHTFTDDGQVKISISCNTVASVAARQTMTMGLNSSYTEDFRLLRRLIPRVREELRETSRGVAGFENITGVSEINSLNSSNFSALFDDEKSKRIQRFITNSAGNSRFQELAAVLNSVLRSSGTERDQRGKLLHKTLAIRQTTSINKLIDQAYQDTKSSLRGVPNNQHGNVSNYQAVESVWNQLIVEGFKKPTENRLFKALKEVDCLPNKVSCNFGQLAALFIARPIREAKMVDEVQMFFHNFNEKCSWMSGLNIANFPILIEGNKGLKTLWKKHRESKPEVTPQRFFTFISNYYFKNQAATAYGLNKFYTRDENGQAKRIEYGASQTARNRAGVGRASAENFAQSLQAQIDETLKRAYGSDNDLRFRSPNIEMIFESVTTDSNKTILKIHFQDRNASKYFLQRQINNAANNNNLNVISRESAEALRKMRQGSNKTVVRADMKDLTGIPNLLTSINKGPLRIKGGPAIIKRYFKEQMPSITIGKQDSSITNVDLKTSTNAGNVDVNISRAYRNRSTGGQDISEETLAGLPMTMMPMQLSLKMIGCPFIKIGQEIFLDAGTNTTADNIYKVYKVAHSIGPGKFETSVELRSTSAYGQYRSALSMARQVHDQIKEIQNATAQNPAGSSRSIAGGVGDRKIIANGIEGGDSINAFDVSDIDSRLLGPGQDVAGKAVTALRPDQPYRIQQILRGSFTPNEDDRRWWQSTKERRRYARSRIISGNKITLSDSSTLSENSLWFKIFGADPVATKSEATSSGPAPASPETLKRILDINTQIEESKKVP